MTLSDTTPRQTRTLRFATEAPDFPVPASEMTGGWEVSPETDGCTVTGWWPLKPHPAWAGVLLMPLLGLKADLGFSRIVAAMADAALERSHPDSLRPRGRLLPFNC